MAANSIASSSTPSAPSFDGRGVALPALQGGMDTDGEAGTIAVVASASSAEDRAPSRQRDRDRDRDRERDREKDHNKARGRNTSVRRGPEDSNRARSQRIAATSGRRSGASTPRGSPRATSIPLGDKNRMGRGELQTPASAPQALGPNSSLPGLPMGARPRGAEPMATDLVPVDQPEPERFDLSPATSPAPTPTPPATSTSSGWIEVSQGSAQTAQASSTPLRLPTMQRGLEGCGTRMRN